MWEGLLWCGGPTGHSESNKVPPRISEVSPPTTSIPAARLHKCIKGTKEIKIASEEVKQELWKKYSHLTQYRRNSSESIRGFIRTSTVVFLQCFSPTMVSSCLLLCYCHLWLQWKQPTKELRRTRRPPWRPQTASQKEKDSTALWPKVSVQPNSQSQRKFTEL